MKDHLQIIGKDKNLLGRPVRVVIGDTGINPLTIPSTLRQKLAYIPWQEASAFKDEPIKSSHGSFMKMLLCEPFNCPQKRSDIEIHSFQCLDRNGVGSADTIGNCLQYAKDRKAKALNLSLGAHFESEEQLRSLDADMERAGVKALGRECYRQGMLIFAAAGNDDEINDWKDDDIDIPALYPWAIGIGSLTDDGRKSVFSGDGKDLEFVADGENIYGYRGNNGTSWASPFVAGFAAYLIAYVYGDISPSKLRVEMRRFAVHGGAYGHRPWCRDHGWGSLAPYTRLVLDHVAKLREEAGYHDDISVFG